MCARLMADSCGVFTDGDLRRVLDREINVHKSTMHEVMTSRQVSQANQLAAEAAH
jgi:arabinose-5-phosphate isomerase